MSKIVLLVLVLLFFIGCGNGNKTEYKEQYSEKSLEVMESKNNPIPKHLYTLPTIEKNH